MAEQFRHTMFASKALGLAETFKLVLGERKLEGDKTFVAELAAPDGPSTAGGKQALQHVSLIPEGGGPTLVLGSANPVEHRAELRTYRYVAQMHSQRWKGAPPPFDRAAYDDLLEVIQDFFARRGFTVTLLDAAAAPASGGTPSALGRGWLLPGLALAAALVVVIFLLRR
jgi:hypothetical protein